jgi:NAD(P)-dependent dehydrogenase (short-subunit alcohol dehydrogenase family)
MYEGRLVGKVVVVTGSTTGIGEGIARQAAEQGASVVIHGTRAQVAEEVAASIVAAGGQATACAGDSADPSTPKRVVEHCTATFGRIDGLVNNAAVSTRSNLETTTPEFFDRIMAINARGPMLFIQAALPHFRNQGRGHVVNIGSINAHSGGRQLLAYSMTKGALQTMTRNLAGAHAKEGIRVNQLNIGWTLTPNEYEGMPENWPDTLGPDVIPFGRMATPKDIAHLVCYLLSDEAELLNGSVIDYDQRNHIGRF